MGEPNKLLSKKITFIQIHGDHHRPNKITDTIILGFYTMKISKPQYLVAAQNRTKLKASLINLHFQIQIH